MNMGVGEAVATARSWTRRLPISPRSGPEAQLCMSRIDRVVQVRENLAIGTKVTLRGERMGSSSIVW